MGRNILVKEQMTDIVVELDSIQEVIWSLGVRLERLKRLLSLRQFEADTSNAAALADASAGEDLAGQ